MADYKELLRRAIVSLPENNGAARRVVYEKARAALVGQLRAINPPLPARDITQHRLQLEDCIRQVEQEASEAVIAGLSNQFEEQRPEPAPLAPKPVPKPAAPLTFDRRTEPEPRPEPRPAPGPEAGSIQDLIEKADQDSAPPPKSAERPKPVDVKPEPEPAPEPAEAESDETPARDSRPLPAIVARAEARKSGTLAFGIPPGKPYDKVARGPTLEPRRESAALAPSAAPRFEPAVSPIATARAQSPLAVVTEPAVAPAMSAVREVDLEREVAPDPQSTIDRAIATLDREARGEKSSPMLVAERGVAVHDEPSKPLFSMPGKRKSKDMPFAAAMPRDEDTQSVVERGFPRIQGERQSGGNALTVFLLVFVLLIAGAGGAGYWAWHEGYINLEAMFANKAPVVEETAAPSTGVPAENVAPVAQSPEPVTDATPPSVVPSNAVTAPVNGEVKGNDRLVPEELLTQPAEVIGTVPPELRAAGEDAKTEERLATNTGASQAPSVDAAIDPAQTAGSQSLLLEASDDGTTGAMPFSGTVEWSRGTDEVGQPTLVGKANIPARNLSVDVLIRKNSDPSLPASHLMEINFNVSETFVGGSITQLPGVLLKNEELVQGTPLVGASARVVGNSFLFALSASAADSTTNQQLLTTRKWMDFALIYGTGKRAIITLEKDETAEGLFRDVFASWSKPAGSANG